MAKNRSHGKIDNLPPELKKAVENKLLEGYTYNQISDYLKSMGHDIHLSSIHRYGNPFLKQFESVRMAKEFARLLAEDNVDRPTTELHEANNAIVSQLIMEALLDEDLETEEKLKAAKSIATLQQAQIRNEKLKIDARKANGVLYSAMELLKQKIFTELGENYPEIADAMLKIADEVAVEMEIV